MNAPSTFWLTLIVAALAMLAPFSIDAYMPAFPAIASELGATPVQMQQTLSFYLAGFAIMNLFYGSISDAFGRRRVVMVSLSGYVLASIGCALAQDIHTLLLMRAAQGIFASAGMVVGRAMIRDVVGGPVAQKIMSHIMLWFALAPALAPVIGGALHTLWGWHAVFWFLAIFAALMLWMIARKMPETLALDQRQSLHPAYLLRMYVTALRHGRFMLLTIAMSLNFGAFFLYITAAPTILYELLGFGANDFWRLFVPLVSGVMVGSFLAGKVAEHWAAARILRTGLTVMGIASLLNVGQALLLSGNTYTTLLTPALYAVGMSFMMPVITIMALDCFPQNRGMASSMQGFLQMGSNALVAGLLTPLLFHSLTALALGMLVFQLLALGLFLFLLRRPVA